MTEFFDSFASVFNIKPLLKSHIKLSRFFDIAFDVDKIYGILQSLGGNSSIVPDNVHSYIIKVLLCLCLGFFLNPFIMILFLLNGLLHIIPIFKKLQLS